MTVQNFIGKVLKFTELLLIKVWVLKTAISSTAILPVDTLRHNNVIVNKNHGAFD